MSVCIHSYTMHTSGTGPGTILHTCTHTYIYKKNNYKGQLRNNHTYLVALYSYMYV